ncbi:hypothetical protein ATZ33_16950 [Enterococcus silesiacus]|uniref:WxL domain-containing protein n=1 Tax=Enterococcus silesiacus TaxID=332949 RepID=A0A0S3KFE2_9ENTE|nr:WxL domain-containing protein [Enterococcus silesiacus]ALS03005.1 hypothetical protein ATZ33_16950 [Enterococcus silesiacus]OJG92947.1 hypothetical protein RV15_GL002081 [Enterococcus silesiacus]
MKTRTLCAVALTAIISSSLVGGAAAFAETTEHSKAGKGIIEIIEDTDDNGDIDPEKEGGGIIPDPDTVDKNTVPGAITIDRVAVLNFGKQKVSTKTETYTASEIPVTEIAADGTENPDKTVRGPYVQWTDKRAGEDHTYAIKAELTKQFTLVGNTKTLDKSTISYKNGLLNSTQENLAYWPAGEPGNFTLGNGTDNEGAGKQLVFDNTKSTGAVGLGTYSAEFGQSADFLAENIKRPGAPTAGIGEAASSVSLKVPAQTVELGAYQADITWSIEYTPAP